MLRVSYAHFGVWVLLVSLSACATAPTPDAEQTLLLVTFKSGPSSAPLPSVGSSRTYSRNGWLISQDVAADIDRVRQRYGLRRVDAWPIKSLHIHCVLFEVSQSHDLNRLLKHIAAEQGVDSAQPLNEFRGLGLPATEIANRHFVLQYGDDATRVASLHRLTRGAPSRIGMIDTLVDQNHPDLRGQVARQYTFVGKPGDNLLHGTAVAGVISANGGDGNGLVGLAPEAKLYVYGACHATGHAGARCNSFTIAKALEQATEDRVDVLNLSLSGPSDALLARQLSVLLARGVIVVAAADPNKPSAGFPASMVGVLAVSGVNAALPAASSMMDDDGCVGWIFDAERLSTRARGGYQFFYGSSMSAAAASGFAALLRSRSGAADTLQEMRAFVAGVRTPTLGRDSDFLVAVRTALRCEDPPRSIAAEHER